MFSLLLRKHRKHMPALLPDDRRGEARHDCHECEELRAWMGSSGWPALIEDISTTGIGLTVGLRHAPGTRVRLRAQNDREEVECEREVLVVRVDRLTDGYWRTGCVFHRPLAPDELQHLLGFAVAEEQS